MPDLDLTNLTIQQVVGLTILTTLIDVLGGITLSIVHGVFNLSYVAVWLQSHVVPRVFPILALAAVGNGIPAFDIPAIPFAYGLALAGLAAYVLETIASLKDSFSDTAPPPVDETPVPDALR